MADVTFRDFAGAIMRGDEAAAASVLEVLLGLSTEQARAAATHFRAQIAVQGAAFMPKAMGLRTAVTTGSDAEIAGLLGDCFGLSEPAVTGAVARLRQHYPPAS
jgi:hypothetical protein